MLQSHGGAQHQKTAALSLQNPGMGVEWLSTVNRERLQSLGYSPTCPLGSPLSGLPWGPDGRQDCETTPKSYPKSEFRVQGLGFRV